MKTSNNPEQIKRLIRILQNLHDFELVVCGWQSAAILRETLGLVRQTCAVADLKAIDMDASGFQRPGDFQDFLKAQTQDNGKYKVFNVIGLESQVKEGQPSTFLQNLNLLRDRLASQYPYSFLFWLPEGLVKRFALDAPDLWSWRNTVLTLLDEDKQGGLGGAVLESYERSAFSNFTLKEKERQIEYLMGLSQRLEEEEDSLKRSKKLATVYFDLGELFRLRGNYEGALKYYKECHKLIEKLGDQLGLAAIYNNIGEIYRVREDYEQALEYYDQSLTFQEKLGDQLGLAASYNNIGLIHKVHGDYEKALKYYKQSLELRKKLGDQEGIANSYNNIGAIYCAQGDYEKALKYYKQSLKIQEKLGDQFGLSALYSNVGEIYRTRGNYEEALKYCMQSLELRKKLGDQEGIANSYNNIGAIYHSRGDYDEALKYINQSLKLDEKLRNQHGMATSYNNIGSIHDVLGDYEKAQIYFAKAKDIAEKIGAKELLKTIAANMEKISSHVS